MILAIDFDGTICTNEYPNCGKPDLEFIKKLIKFREKGHKLILWTCRTDRQLEEAIEFCGVYGLEFDEVNKNLPELIASFGGDTRKVVADLYIDDRNASVMNFMELL